MEHAAPGALVSEGSEGTAAAPGGHFFIMLFIGLHVAHDRQSCRKGLLALLAPSIQSDGDDVLTKASDALANC